MCVVSAMGDGYKDHFDQDYYKGLFKKYEVYTGSAGLDPYQPYQPLGGFIPSSPSHKEFNELKDQFNKLKTEVEEMHRILRIAADYDKRNNEPHCEMEDKVKLLKEVAKMVGVDLSDVFPPQPQVITFNPPYTSMVNTIISESKSI